MYKILLTLLSVTGIISLTQAQELNCQVSVIAPTLQGNSQNEEVIEQLKAAAFEFLNETKWTNDNFKQEERIECNVLINISKVVSTDTYEGSIQVSSSRPVYNSNYKTRLFNHNDANLRFTYMRNTALVYTPDRASVGGLVDVLAYYAYIVIGMDYDSFSLKGGDPYFLKAQQIVSNYSNNTGDKGWGAKFLNNRFHLVNNLLQDMYSPLRNCHYNYHLVGMDNLYAKKEEAVNKILMAVKEIEKVYKSQPGSFNIQSFFNAKYEELINIFIEAQPAIRVEAYRVFSKLDPGHITQYNAIKRGKR
ncbi:MAG: DUF4835 family protein [Flavobacteriales bacterium]|jgi:hypothetical protein|nr:DUF4835 family protein [Flavobacteriales bacterium]